MSKNLGVKTIEMYCQMIEEEFKPVLAFYEGINQAHIEEVKAQVRKDFGIYKKVIQLAGLQKKVEELKAEVNEWEQKTYSYNGSYSKVDREVERRIKAETNNPKNMVEQKMNDLIKGVRLSGCAEDVRQMFLGISKFIEEETKKIKSLPIPKKPEALEIDI